MDIDAIFTTSTTRSRIFSDWLSANVKVRLACRAGLAGYVHKRALHARG
jgi:hypothetical protein